MRQCPSPFYLPDHTGVWARSEIKAMSLTKLFFNLNGHHTRVKKYLLFINNFTFTLSLVANYDNYNYIIFKQLQIKNLF